MNLFILLYFSTISKLVLVEFFTINPLKTYFIPLAPSFVSTLSSYSFKNILVSFTMDLSLLLNISFSCTSFKFLCIFTMNYICKYIVYFYCATCCHVSIALYLRYSTIVLLEFIKLSL